MLLAAFPASKNDPLLTARAYLTALDGADIRDVQSTVTGFLSGKIERDNHEFAPSAATLAKEVQRAKDERMAAEWSARNAISHSKPDDDWTEPTDEQKANVADMAERAKAILASAGASMRMDNPKKHDAA